MNASIGIYTDPPLSPPAATLEQLVAVRQAAAEDVAKLQQLVAANRVLDEGREHDRSGDMKNAVRCYKYGAAELISRLKAFPSADPILEKHRPVVQWAVARSEVLLKALGDVAALGFGPRTATS